MFASSVSPWPAPLLALVQMVDQWWKISVRPGQSVDLIQELFLAAFSAAGRPRGAALFENDVAERRTALFFSPRAAAFAEALLRGWGGKPAIAPETGYFLVGDESSQTLLPSPD
jgi:hypothetical protein